MEYLTPKELAEKVNAHHYTILRLIKEGEIKADNVGGRYMIKANEANKWIKKLQTATDGRRLKVEG